MLAEHPPAYRSSTGLKVTEASGHGLVVERTLGAVAAEYSLEAVGLVCKSPDYDPARRTILAILCSAA